MPQFAHLPLLLKPEGNGKLSKRDGDRLGFPVFALEWKDPGTGEISSGYRESGYFPEAVTNMLALLGWHPSGNQEMFSMQELIDQFSLERVSKAGAKFDLNKAFWFNQQYLMQKSPAEVYDMIQPLVEAKGWDTCREYVEQVVVLMREKVRFAKEIVEQGTYFFETPEKYDDEVIKKKWKEETNAHLLAIAQGFAGLAENAQAAEYEQVFKDYCENAGVKSGELLQPLRLAVSGEGVGAPIWEMMSLIGRDFIVPRIELATTKISFPKA